jgi:hypothetical protein
MEALPVSHVIALARLSINHSGPSVATRDRAVVKTSRETRSSIGVRAAISAKRSGSTKYRSGLGSDPRYTEGSESITVDRAAATMALLSATSWLRAERGMTIAIAAARRAIAASPLRIAHLTTG